MDTTAIRLLDYHAQTPMEKVYLRTDKEIYAYGDVLWFSAYVVDATTHQPRNISNLLYVDLLDDRDSVLSTLNIQLTDGVGAGDFTLTDTLSEGIYRVRGYTNYMRNFDPAFHFSKPIKLLDYSSRTKVTDPVPELENIEMSFFPEGGDLLAGDLNYVAFKAINAKGIGVPVSGIIVDESGQEIQKFETTGLGMGIFQLTPEPGKKYFAKYEVANVSFSKELPDVQSDGFLTSVRQTVDKIFLTVKPIGKESIEGAFVLAHVRGTLVLAVPSTPGQSFIYVPLPGNQIPTGIVHFTVFDRKGFPRAERLVYNENPGLRNSLAVEPKKETFDTREKADFDLDLTNNSGEKIDGKISVSILSNSLLEANKINILNYLYLTSDLKGTVENPSIFFNEGFSDRERLLDLLMRVNGWRRFDWDKVIERDLPPVNYFPETGFSVEGQVVRYLNRNKPVLGKVELSFLEDITFKKEAISREDGIFWFDDLQIADSVTAIIQTSRLKEDDEKGFKEVKGGTFIKLNQKTSPEFVHSYLNPFAPDEELVDYVDNTLKIRNIEAQFDPSIIVLDEIEVETQRDIQQDPFYRESILYSRPDSRLIMDSLIAKDNYFNLFDLMRDKFPGVEITGSFPTYSVIIRGRSTISLSNEALFLVDGIPTDASLVAQIPPSQVEFIDVLRGTQAAIYSAQGNGVIAIYRYKGPRAVAEVDPIGLLTFEMTGYYPPREFYVPQYDQMTAEEKIRPDFRSTLYWNPNIQVEKGKATFSFFTSDQKDDFTLYVEGLDENGQVIITSKTFNVN